jgi:SprT protein
VWTFVHDGHMTTLNWAQRRTYELLREFGLAEWLLTFDNARQRAGQTRYASKSISLSRYFVQANSPERVEQTIRHEVAHALAGPGAGHGPEWKRQCQIVGFTGGRTYDPAETVMPPAAWKGTCGCGQTWTRHRLSARAKQGAYCTDCNGKITWVRLAGLTTR